MGLFVIILMTLMGPFVVKKIEHNLEAFLLVMGILAVTVAGFESQAALEAIGYTEEQITRVGWNMPLVMEALEEPIIKGAVPFVLFFGIIFHFCRRVAQDFMAALFRAFPPRAILFLMIVGLGFASSIIIPVLWAAILMVELVSCMPLDRQTKINIMVTACFSIGLGAVLTPFGQPLSTIATVKLMGEPYNAGFFFLFNQLAVYVVPGVLAMGLLGAFFIGRKTSEAHMVAADDAGSLRDVVARGVKVYAFIAALLLLSDGTRIVMDKYLFTAAPQILYWANMISAVLDDALFAAMEISPAMEITQIQAVLMGLLISGGMLIPGSIPNIISAGKLGITSREWAKLGVPLGLVLMGLYYVWIFYTPFHVAFNL